MIVAGLDSVAVTVVAGSEAAAALLSVVLVVVVVVVSALADESPDFLIRSLLT